MLFCSCSPGSSSQSVRRPVCPPQAFLTAINPLLRHRQRISQQLSSARTMLAKCRHNVADVSQRVSSTISQAFWTVVYFFYFLVKGNPNWKCERYSVETLKNCCVEARKTEQAHSKAASQKASQPSSTFRPGEANNFPKKRIWSRISEWFRKIKDVVVLYTRRIGRFLYDIACMVARFLRTVAQYLWAVIRAIFWPNVKSKPLPRSAPKPFSAKAQESPSFNKVQFLPEESLEKQELQPEQTAMPPMASEPEPVRRRQPTPAERLQMYTSEQANLQQNATPVAMPRQTTYAAEQPLQYEETPGPSTYRFTDTSLDATHRETREDATMDPWEYVPQQSATTKKEPPGIGKLPADVMAELHGTQKMRLEREASVQREMTQSCHPDMAQWKTQENESRYDRSATATPYRASSVGPTMRKLEQVVSRLDDANENEAQYVFRAKPSDYMMGKSVFTPMEEAERIRDTINRSSRPVTPAHSVVSGRMTPYGQESYASHSYKREEDGSRRRARTVGPIGRESMPRTSGFYAMSPVTSHTARRTPVPFDRGTNFAYDRDKVTQGVVSNQVRHWPPASNASGAEVSKDEWIKEVVREQEDGLITTMCRRVVERKTEDNWKWRDDQGHLLDEKNQRTWKGELDTVLRDGPGEARHWSRTVEVLPSGDTRFQDVSRQYNRDFVVESIVRNY